MYVVSVVCVLSWGQDAGHRIGLGRACWPASMQQGTLGEGPGRNDEERSFRVSSGLISVVGVPVRLEGPVGRCVSSADTSLSLSLSLLSRSRRWSARRTAPGRGPPCRAGRLE